MRRFLVLTLGLCLLLSGCASRRSKPLLLSIGDFTTKAKLDQTELARSTVLGNPADDQPLRFGGGTVMVLTLSARGENRPQPKDNVILLDELLICRLYVQLPLEPVRETIDLSTASFVRMLGRYDVPDSALVYRQGEGTLVVDSLKKSWLYGTIAARYRNAAGAQLSVNGPFRIRTRR